MDISTELPGYLKAADIPKAKLLTIKGCAIEQLGDELKPCLEFEESQSKLVLNKTNIATLVEAFATTETDDWIGQPIVVYRTQTEFSGKRVDCLRVRMPKDDARRKQAAEGLAKAAAEANENDDIPF